MYITFKCTNNIIESDKNKCNRVMYKQIFNPKLIWLSKISIVIDDDFCY